MEPSTLVMAEMVVCKCSSMQIFTSILCVKYALPPPTHLLCLCCYLTSSVSYCVQYHISFNVQCMTSTEFDYMCMHMHVLSYQEYVCRELVYTLCLIENLHKKHCICMCSVKNIFCTNMYGEWMEVL